MKQLFTEAAESFVEWLTMGSAIFVRLVSTTLEAEDIYTDILCEVLLHGQMALLHVEFQKKRDSSMAERLWSYNVRATLKYKCPVWSCVIYLTKDSTVSTPYCKIWPDDNRTIHQFHFSIVKLWELSTQGLLEEGLPDLAPLLVLTREGKSREVIETAITLLDPPEKLPKRELLALTYGLASLVFSEEADQEWLAWRFSMLYDILKDTRAFHDMEKRAREEATKAAQQAIQEKAQAAQEKAQQASLRDIRLVILEVVEGRFADALLVEQARASLERLDDLETLRQLVVKVALAQKAEEVSALLEQIAVPAPAATSSPAPGRKRAARRQSTKQKA